MKALFAGLVFILFAVYAVLPPSLFGYLNWWNEVLAVLKGAVPLMALLIGLVAVLIGIADIKDSIEEKKEAAEEKKAEAEAPKA